MPTLTVLYCTTKYALPTVIDFGPGKDALAFSTKSNVERMENVLCSPPPGCCSEAMEHQI